MTNEILQAILHAVDSNDDDAAERAVSRLTAADVPALADAVELLDSPDADRRWWAVRTLAALGKLSGESTSLAAPLSRLLHDADPSVRCAAALAIGELGLADAVDELVCALGDESGWVRGCAADALALVGPAAVPALIEILKGDLQSVRTRAAYAMSKIRTLEAANAFYYCLSDENPLVQMYAYDTLEQMGLLQMILLK